jgi:acyl-CoA synthetase (AMP-forming)/AMP-acid ligase II
MSRIDLSGGMVPASTRTTNLSHLLSGTARRHPDRVGLIQGERRWTFAELDARAGAFARVLHDHGIGKGDRLLVQSSNCLQMFEAIFGCWRAGAVWVPANFRLTPAEVAQLAEDAQAKALLVHADFPAHAEACAPFVDVTLWIGGTDPATDYEALIGAASPAPDPAAVGRDDPCWFFFTSGTTGRSKAAVLTHGQMNFVVNNHLADLMPGCGHEFGGTDASLVLAPLSHAAGIHELSQVARAVPSVLAESTGLDGAEVWRLVERHRISNLFTVPTLLKMLVEHPAVHDHDHSSLRHVIYAGSPMYRADQIRALETLGPCIVQYFGLGEVTGNITVLPPALHAAGEDPRLGTCGFARTGMQVQVQRDEGTECAPGETGEICVIGPAVFAGYFNNPAANAKAFRDGWFRTGDLGHLDAQGFLYITGRASDMFISGGSNVYPREIEEKLLLHPAVAEVAVLGVPDPTWGEVGMAVVVPRAPVQAAELAEWLAPQLARYKQPRHWALWEALPKSGYGKIAKRLIRDELVARGLWPG